MGGNLNLEPKKILTLEGGLVLSGIFLSELIDKMAERSKALRSGRSPQGVAGSNPALVNSLFFIYLSFKNDLKIN